MEEGTELLHRLQVGLGSIAVQQLCLQALRTAASVVAARSVCNKGWPEHVRQQLRYVALCVVLRNSFRSCMRCLSMLAPAACPSIPHAYACAGCRSLAPSCICFHSIYGFLSLYGDVVQRSSCCPHVCACVQDHLEQHPNKEEPLPMFTSCCPGWVAMVEKSNPELIPYLSSCKSPQMMLGAVIKNYYAKEAGVTPDDICNVSVMPCVRKQGEADREWFNTTGLARDVDHVVTTAELGKIFSERGIKLNELPESPFDNPIGEGTGGALLFGTTGGVMEAALRTVYELVSNLPSVGLITQSQAFKYVVASPRLTCNDRLQLCALDQ